MDPTQPPDDSQPAPEVPLLIAALVAVIGIVVGFLLGRFAPGR